MSFFEGIIKYPNPGCLFNYSKADNKIKKQSQIMFALDINLEYQTYF